MSALPEQYQRFAQPGPRPAYPAAVELRDEADPIVHVPDPYDPNRSIEVRRSALQPAVRPEPRDLTPQPLFDPLAQRLAAGGVLGAGVGWGAAQLLTAVAGAGAGLLAFALLLLAARLGGARSVTNVRQEVHNHNSWWGSSSTEL
ncbi:hypothetical protein ACPESV_24525 [Streptomyces umbrinus]|uniref:hypothetical protein n=1 Tax=Streptomyces umbrinus TaxID=67370 RepID=UPI003C2CE1AE